MALDQYRRKRKFDQTPEPPPPEQTTPVLKTLPEGGRDGARFYIQRHQARRLHYDLRLELGGTLKSWAVPKGPTLDPAEKRLAVMVEDHPLEYGEFEGTIPEGNYGAGAVRVWDKGTYEMLGDTPAEQQLERGDFKFRLHGRKLSGEFALVRMKNRGKGNEWLLLKKKDFAAQPGWDAEDQSHGLEQTGADPAQLPGAAAAEMPHQLKPMLATLTTKLPEGAEWVYEVKWDGVRALCYLDRRAGDGKGPRVRIISRNGNAMEQQYPEIAEALDELQVETAILDGEIVALDPQGRPSFGLLQSRFGISASAAAKLSATQPVFLFAFDLPYLNGYDLRQSPLVERKRMLAAILKPHPRLRFSEHFTGEGQKLLDAASAQGLEGVLAKRALSRYESRRGGDWLKKKIVAEQDFIICGYTSGERKPFGSLVLGYHDGGKLLYAGNVGTGFDDRKLKDVFRLLQPLATEKTPLANTRDVPRETTWVKPQLVCMVKFAEWTRDGRLRAPVFLGLRADADPAEVVRETAEPAPGTSESAAARSILLAAGRKEAFADVDGRRLKFTNLDKVFYPDRGFTKRDLINFYDGVADLLVPYMKDRPLSLKRYPNGIQGDYFFQKAADESWPDWLRIEPVVTNALEPPTHYVIGNDRATLLYLANLACIDQNPWMSRMGSQDNPDFILVDLDPVDCAFDRIVEAALLMRGKLEAIGLEGYPKTTGGDGLHIYVPLEPVYSYHQVRTFAEILARLVAAERPDLFTTPRAVARREKGKVYFDYLQIGEGKTIAAPYVLRAYPGAPVATPLRWSEVRPGLSPLQFNLANALDRFARLGDVFRAVLDKPQRLELALPKLEQLVKQAAQ